MPFVNPIEILLSEVVFYVAIRVERVAVVVHATEREVSRASNVLKMQNNSFLRRKVHFFQIGFNLGEVLRLLLLFSLYWLRLFPLRRALHRLEGLDSVGFHRRLGVLGQAFIKKALALVKAGNSLGRALEGQLALQGSCTLEPHLGDDLARVLYFHHVYDAVAKGLPDSQNFFPNALFLLKCGFEGHPAWRD